MSISEELSLVTKLRALGIRCNAFDGLTSIDARREKVRAALRQVQDVTFTTRDGKNISMGQQFHRVYSEPL